MKQSTAKSAVAFSCLGWAFDLFDLFILLYIAPSIARAYFGSGQSMLALTGVYLSFAVTLLMRPVGGALFGQYADNHGRKRAMVTTSIGVGVLTALMGAIPSTATIGYAAPIIFFALRLAQGIFMGGMVASTHTLGTESMPQHRRGLAAGIISGGGSGIGKLIASLVFLILTFAIPEQAFFDWGWRCMFFAGALSAVLGLVVSLTLNESPLWEEQRKLAAGKAAYKEKTPLKTLFSAKYARPMSTCIALTFTGSALSYLTSGYLPTFLRIVNHVPGKALGTILSLCAIAVICSSIFAGWLTDLVDKRKALAGYGLACLIIIPSLYTLLTSTTNLFAIGAIAVILSGVGTLCYAPLMVTLNERFPTRIRASGTAVCWNIGFALGGSMPAVVSGLSPTAAQVPLLLAIFTAAAGCGYLVSVATTSSSMDGLANAATH